MKWIITLVLLFNVALAQAESALAKVIAETGANVMFMRHALAPGYGDPSHFDVNDCATQRNLDATGRAQAKALGKVLGQHQIRFDEIKSSQWCRCQETARLLNVGKVVPFAGLNSFFEEHADREQTLSQLKSYLDSLKQDDLVLLVTHQVVISAVTGIYAPSGGVVLFNTTAKASKALDLQRYE
jgi:broad specificity phosphatase PhoE